MPKSSSAIWTPSDFSSQSRAIAPVMSLTVAVSVISRTSRSAGSPEDSSAWATTSARFGSRSWRAEMFTLV